MDVLGPAAGKGRGQDLTLEPRPAVATQLSRCASPPPTGAPSSGPTARSPYLSSAREPQMPSLHFWAEQLTGTRNSAASQNSGPRSWSKNSV